MKKHLIIFLILFAFIGCKKEVCDESFRIGETVEIPIEFNGFNVAEIDSINVYRIDKSNFNLIDTFLLKELLWLGSAQSTNELLTDSRADLVKNHYGYYDSYLNNSHLILDWKTGKDTLTDIIIQKSKEEIKGCHANDSNVKIDKLSFVHKGKTISKDESIQINK